MATDQDWIADLLAGYKQVIDSNGNSVPQRNVLQILGASFSDNPNYQDPVTEEIVGSTIVTLPSAGTANGLSFAALSTTSPVNPSGNANIEFVSYYSTPGDGGGGFFAWAPTSTATPDHGTIVQVTGITTGRWLRQFSGYLDVRWFGAAGDGATRDDTAIGYALAAATLGVGGGVVYFGSGTYLIYSQIALPYNVSLLGNGYSSIIQNGAANGIYLSPAGGKQVTGYIMDMAVVAGGGTALTGIFVNNAAMTRIDRCVVDSWPRQGVFFQDTILSEMSLTAVGGCGSLTGGVNGGTGYAAVEVDSANVSGNAGGSGSTTWSWWNNNVSNNTGTGLRIDRTGPSLVHGGTSEGANMPYCIEMAGKTETVSGAGACAIEALDLEIVSPSAGGAVAFVAVGYGLNGTSNSNATAISIRHCTLVTDAGFTPYGVKAKYAQGFYMQGNIVQLGSSGQTSSTANVWFEGNTCSAMVIAADNIFDNGSTIPLVIINGAQDHSAKQGQHWSFAPAAFGGGTYGSSWNVPKVSTPTTPASGFTFYVDSADSKFKAVGSSGTVNVIDATALTP